MSAGASAIGKLFLSIIEVPECRVFQMLASRFSSFFGWPTAVLVSLAVCCRSA